MAFTESLPAADQQAGPRAGWAYGLALVLSLALLALGIILAAIDVTWSVLAVGVWSVVAMLLAWPVLIALKRAAAGAQARHAATLKAFSDQLERHASLLNLISEQQLLSDRAKAIAFREKDRQALRQAVEEEIGREDWESAMLLAGEIESQFGNRQEADQFRQQIIQGRRRIARQEVDQAIATVDRHVRAEQWGQALHEADRIATAHPEDEQARNLPQEVQEKREQHKNRLIENWKQAVARKDTDGGIEILKQLDNYLTPAEAESLQESARNVFKDKLNSLRLEFTAAVQANHWHKALDLAETIRVDFPNTRIAQEVGDKMDALRRRAAGETVEV